jgi:anti-anti-sigma factor
MFKLEIQDNRLLVSVETSSFEAGNIAQFQEAYEATCKEAPHAITFDLERVNMIDSLAIGTLLKYRKLTADGSNLKLTNVKPSVIAILEMLRLHKVFEVELADAASLAR